MTRAVILGGAACVWDDLSGVERLVGEPWPDLVIAVNDAGAAYPGRLHHWVSLHPDKFPPWECERQRRGLNVDYETWAHQSLSYAPVTHALPLRGSGSSGFHAVRVAQELGCERVVLCGVPMNADPHFHNGVAWNDVKRYLPAWEHYKHEFSNVRSMSGHTRELLGAPTAAWLRGED